MDIENGTPVSELSPQQLQQYCKQLEQEILFMKSSLTQLKSIQDKFSSSKEAIVDISKNNEALKMLVPLTGSMYVPGTIDPKAKVMVDIGTGYYVEKSRDDAVEFFTRKIDMLQKEMEQVQPVYQEKYAQKHALLEVLQSKMQAVTSNSKMTAAN